MLGCRWLISAPLAGKCSPRQLVSHETAMGSLVVAVAFAAPVGAFNPVGNAGAVGAGDRFLRLLKEVMPGYSANSSAIAGWPEGPHGPYTLEGGWPIYSETSAYCVVMWLSGKAVADPGTLVVEMGTLLGHSSRCLASGLELRQDVAKLRKAAAESLYLAFDFFRSVPSPAKKLFRDAEAARVKLWLPYWLHKPRHPVLAAVQHASGASSRGYQDSVWGALMVDPVYHGPHRAVPGDIGKLALVTLATFAPEVPIEVFSIDSAKSHDQFINQAASVWPRLRVGSVIHLLDVSSPPTTRVLGKHTSHPRPRATGSLSSTSSTSSSPSSSCPATSRSPMPLSSLRVGVSWCAGRRSTGRACAASHSPPAQRRNGQPSHLRSTRSSSAKRRASVHHPPPSQTCNGG